MSKSQKVTNVQVPGEKAPTAAATPANQPENPAEKPAAAPKVEVRTARDYRNMPASEIDATKLKAPVLSKDGWVCPA